MTARPSALHAAPGGYRPDIDGLRAAAILSVVGYHAFPEVFEGGFIGVDVFFVISGYLISKIVFAKMETGSFGFMEFYARRICRIFPALVAMLLCSFVLAFVTLFPWEFQQFGKQLFFGAGFATNVLALRDVGYFAEPAKLRPLLHLWSLAVEEQFYLVWPLMVYAVFRLKAHSRGVYLGILTASFVLNVAAMGYNEAFSFLLPVTRLWQLAAGALLAFGPASGRPGGSAASGPSGPSGPFGARGREAQSILGLGLVLFSAAALSERMAYPGWWALLPTAGACLLISSGPGTWIGRALLSNRPMVFLGLVSYPLYLWHWPMLAFAAILGEGATTPGLQAALVAASLIPAWITWRFVERPVRASGRKSLLAALLCLAMALIGGAGLAARLGKFQPLSVALQPGLSKSSVEGGLGQFPNPNFAAFPFRGVDLYLREGSRRGQAVFFGDSNMEMYMPRIDKLIAERPGETRSAVFGVSPGCLPIQNFRHHEWPGCHEYFREALEYGKQPEVESVVVGGAWFDYFGPASPFFHNGTFTNPRPGVHPNESAYLELEAMLAGYVRQGKKAYLVLNIPLGAEVKMKRTLFPSPAFEIIPSDVDEASMMATYGDVHRRLVQAARRSGAEIIDPREFLCAAGTCPSMTAEGERIYKDRAHLHQIFAMERAKYLDRIMLE